MVDPHGLLANQTRKAYYFGDSLLDAIVCCGVSGEDPSDITGGRHKFFATLGWIKTAASFVVCLLYVFCILWLMFGIQSLSLCAHDEGKVQFPFTDATNNDSRLVCGQLLNQCSIPFISPMPVMNYYVFRISMYLLSAIPFAFLVGGSSAMTDRFITHLFPPYTAPDKGDTYIEPTLDDQRTAAESAATAQRKKLKGIFKDGEDSAQSRGWWTSCCVLVDPNRYDTDSYIKTTAIVMFFTHVLLGGISIAADIAVISYFGGLHAPNTSVKACPSAQSNAPLVSFNFAQRAADSDCACQAIFPPATGAASVPLIRLSGFELMYPSQVAWALLVMNVFYTLFGLSFVMRTATHMNNRDEHYKQKSALHTTERKVAVMHTLHSKM